MAETTHISWSDATFNPWIGCTKVSNGPLGACEGCYAENLMANRMGRVVWGKPGQKGTLARTSGAYWKQPLAWDRKATAAGTRPFVFCASLADVFDNQADPDWRGDLFELIRATPHLVWLLLTKRPQNIVKLFVEATGMPAALPRNAAIGCTVVTQAEADRDVPHLLAAKAALDPAFAFVSMEPLLGAVDLTALPSHLRGEGRVLLRFNALSGHHHCGPAIFGDDSRKHLDWIIAGGETDQGGHKARLTHPDWFRSLRDQCAVAGVPFHFKQHGEWIAGVDAVDAVGDLVTDYPWDQIEQRWMVRLGKKLSGRRLDGVEHNARPDVPALAGVA